MSIPYAADGSIDPDALVAQYNAEQNNSSAMQQSSVTPQQQNLQIPQSVQEQMMRSTFSGLMPDNPINDAASMQAYHNLPRDIGAGIIGATNNALNNIKNSLGVPTQQLDVNKIFGVQNPDAGDAFLQGLAPAALVGAATGGLGTLGSIGTGMAYGLSQSDPGNRLIPTALGAAGGALGPIAKGVGYLKNIWNNSNAEGAAQDLLQTLTNGKPDLTKQDNIQNLSNLVQSGYKNQQTQLGGMYDYINNSLGIRNQKNIYNRPLTDLPEGNMGTITNLFDKNIGQVPDNANQSLASAINSYRRSGGTDLDSFIDKTNNILGTDKDLAPSTQNKLEEMLDVPYHLDAAYNPNATYQSKSLQNLHDQFIQNPTFENAHQLQSQMGKQANMMQQSLNKNFDYDIQNQLDDLLDNKNSLNADMDQALNTVPGLKDINDVTRQEYRERIGIPYDRSNPVIRQMINPPSPNPGGFNPTGINPLRASDINKFAFGGVNPNVLNDIGPQGQNAILYNMLKGASKDNPQGLANQLQNLYQEGGAQNFFTPQILQQKQTLDSVLKNQKTLQKYKNFGANALTKSGYAGAAIGGGLEGLHAIKNLFEQ